MPTLPKPVLEFLQSLPLPPAPDWLVHELQQRWILLLNHVLMQEVQATQRLQRQQGRVLLVRWRDYTFRVQVTPAGLLDLAPAHSTPDLTLLLAQESPLDLANSVWRGQKPTVRIEGDVQLAADVNWLVDNLRWDLEEDLSRLMGDAPAHLLVQALHGLADALRALRPARTPESAHGSGGFGATGHPVGTASPGFAPTAGPAA